MPTKAIESRVLVLIVLAVLLWSGIRPHDQFTWFLEVAPVIFGLPIVYALRHRLPFTPLVLRLLALHAIILMIGGHWTYARVPIGDWVQERLGLARNPYDRLGHIVQGFVPALLAREVLLRRTPLRPGGWLLYLCTSVALAISAVYELIEWTAALATGAAANDFLGSQGDIWDTQWDMFLALLGALAALLSLSNLQDRQMARMAARQLTK